MKTIDLHQVDAFTDRLFGGNPAGVVTNADGLTDNEMRNIAREMNLSETAFVLQPTTTEAEMKLRFFTPTAEVKFCGHATVGTLLQLARLHLHGLGRAGKNSVQVETNVGVLSMTVINAGATPQVTFTAPHVVMEKYRLQGKAFADEFGIPASILKPGGTVLVDRALQYVYVPASSVVALGAQQFDFTRIRERFANEGVVVFCLFTNETLHKGSDLHARGLAPNVGIDEDPFTGSMQAGLIHAAKRNSCIATNQSEVVVEQGDFVGRPGSAKVSHDVVTDRVDIIAGAVCVFSTKMEV